MDKTISPHVRAGGQPLASDLEKLKKEGVATVVNLRLEEEKSPLAPAEERSLAEKLGLDYHHLPVSLDRLDPAQVEEVREIFKNSPGPVFVHCGMGQRACSFSLAALELDADSIFEESAKLGSPIQNEKLRTFLKNLKQWGSSLKEG